MLYMYISFDEDEQETKSWSEINQYVTLNTFYSIIIIISGIVMFMYFYW